MGLSRKDFLLSSAGLFAMAGGLTRNGLMKTISTKPLSSSNMAMLYDSSKCIGCKMCEEGCIKENNLPREREPGELSETSWTAIQATPNSDGKKLYLKRQCMHCTDASCVAVCPTGAAAHHGEYVVIDQNWCIGCGYCEEACPFGVPHRGHPPDTARKCTFCFENVMQGSKPCCVEACPTGAATFGARTDLLVTAKARVQNLTKLGWPEAQLYGEDVLGGLSVVSILLKPPAFYGLPEEPRQATKNVLTQWASGSLAAAALILPFGYLYSKRVEEKDILSVKQKEGA